MGFAFPVGIVVRAIQVKAVPIHTGKDDRMIPKPLHNAAQVMNTLAAAGCQVRIEEDALVVHDPYKTLTDELRDQVHKHRLAILALLLRQALLHLLQVLDMAQPAIRVGMQEEYAGAFLAALRLVGDPWEGQEEEMDMCQE
jgi:TubC N-terminal docking domain